MNCPPCMCIQSSYSNLQVVAELSNRCFSFENHNQNGRTLPDDKEG